MKISKRNNARRAGGFTLVELLLGSSILLIVVIGTLSLFERSNKISVDQTRFSEVQHDVRSAMYFVSRDARMAGVGLEAYLTGYGVEGQDAWGPSPESSDCLKMMGNFDYPLKLNIREYNAGSVHGSENVFLYDYELENTPYQCPEFFENKVLLIISTRCPGCYAFRFAATNSVQGCGEGTAHIVFNHGRSDINPPGGLIDIEAGCTEECWDDAFITFGQVKFYWLDSTGDPDDYPDLNLTTGQDGYLGIPNVLYLSTNSETGVSQHMPLAMNIENLQFEYNGDFDADGNLDGFRVWDNVNWTILATDDAATRQTKRELLAKLSQIRIQILGRTPEPYLTVSKTAVTDVQLYRRPALSNSPAATGPTPDDWRRRFLLESTATIRNNALVIYNTGQH